MIPDDGDGDMGNAAGDSYLLDLEMDKALEFRAMHTSFESLMVHMLRDPCITGKKRWRTLGKAGRHVYRQAQVFRVLRGF